ncbi:hypothetical protein ACFL05_00015 [Patescibacteria group bacterium]
MKKINSSRIVDVIVIYIISIVGVILYIPSATLLYPIGYFSHVIAYLLLFSIIGMFFIYKKPNIAKNLFLINGIGTLLTTGLYILTTEQDWTVFNFMFEILTLSCFFILFSAYLLRKKI